MKSQSTYQTKRLLLRSLEFADYKAWLISQERTFPALNKFDTGPLLPERRTRPIFNESIREQRRQAKQDSRYVWNAFLRSTGELVGFFDIKPISREPHKMADIGYFITNSYRGRGYGREAIRRLIKASFQDLDLHRLEAVIDPDNKASIAAAKASGLYREGIKKHYWFQNGRWEDQVIFIATPELFR